MKFRFIIAAFLGLAFGISQARMTTEWTEKVDVDNVWNVYPRPTMERSRWMNLNGKWNYAITPRNDVKPSSFEGKILVPFAVESYLSGVERTVGVDSVLWYNRTFKVPASWKGDDVLLNFGAVDWKVDVWVNGMKVGSHTGGYSPFSFNITDALRNGENEITVKVWDPSDKGQQPRGKQVAKPGGIFYTPVTGIWQTVWLEPVAKTHISRLKITPDIDSRKLTVEALTSGPAPAETVTVNVLDDGKIVASGSAVAGNPVEIEMPADMKLWSTDAPFLYDLDVKATKGGKTVDAVKSYAAMRKISYGRDNNGVNASNMMRLRLNNEDIFQFGPLDQGYWPDGLYTAPTYEAMVFDIDKTKDLGFNMIRKHVKVEPEVWYEYCDRNGIIVWQDMPSGSGGSGWQNHDYFKGEERKKSPEVDREFRKEWQEIIEALYNHPSIAVWVPFNESWGQYDTVNIANWTKELDPSRLVNPASGGNFFDCGDILDVHNYPAPMIYLLSYGKANVIGEYGGIGLALDGHLWMPDRNWGYIQFKTPAEVTEEYLKYLKVLEELAGIAYTGAVYTQTTDVEGEVNGLITYDRRKVKVDEKRIGDANRALIRRFSGNKR